MTIVELVDSHQGFSIITDKITTKRKVPLMWILCVISFFFSAVLDNLTTSIVMAALISKNDKRQKRLVDVCRDDYYLSKCWWSLVSNGGCNNNNALGRWTSYCLEYYLFNLHSFISLYVIVPLFTFSFKLKGSIETLT